MMARCFLPSNEPSYSPGVAEEPEMADAPAEIYPGDWFHMYEFKVRRCPRGRSHEWTECPYAHPGEKARRRDPRKFRYSSAACPEFRKGGCKKGDACELSHGVFECWLHPERYRTQPCKDGAACRRRVCFFAHNPEQLRLVSPRAPKGLINSPTSTLVSPPMSPAYDSPPVSPSGVAVWRGSLPLGSSVNEVMVSLRKLQLGTAKPAAASWGLELQMCGGFGEGFSTVLLTEAAGGDAQAGPEEEPAVPDVGWVTELVK